jgi:adenylate cyclase
MRQQNPRLLSISGERYLSLALPVDAHLQQPLYVLIQGSYDRALAPLHTLQWRIALIGTIALAGALLCGVLLAGGITGPVRLLVNAMHEIPRGNLRHRIQIDRDDEIGFLSRSFNEMADGLEEREHIKDTFGRFVSRDVAQAVLSGQVPLAGERREVSILFQDIRGFTALSEKLDPVALLRLLNQFFTEVVAAVEAEGGVVKQFTGDGVMALFGAPQSRTDHTERAVRAALGIVSRLTQLNVLLQKEGLAPLLIGIGIHTGEVVAGLIGPDERIEYGVVGEPVNLASRIEALTKELTATILVSKEIAGRLGSQFVLGRTALLPVKGKSQPVEVIEVLTQR